MNATITLTSSDTWNLSYDVWDFMAFGSVPDGPLIRGDDFKQNMKLGKLNLKGNREDCREQWDLWCKQNKVGNTWGEGTGI